MPDKTKVALYCRVANEDDDAIANQESILRKYSAEHGYDNITVYVDNGVSGLNFDRPALSRLETDIAAGNIGTVIVRNFDRIGREFIMAQDWIVNIRRKGVSFISIADGLDDSLFDEKRLTMLEVLASQKIFAKK